MIVGAVVVVGATAVFVILMGYLFGFGFAKGRRR